MNLKAKNIMETDIISINEDDSVYEAIELLLNNKINCLPIQDKERLLKGIVTETDLIYVDKKLNPSSYYAYGEANVPINTRILNKSLTELKTLKIKEVMTSKLISVQEDTELEKIIDIIVNKGIKTIPVIKDLKIIGIVTRKNILKYYL
ncbi:CBS domain-containing protein [Alkaliphilus peptidifermentans]|uniref:CBS domain-containing protein n=1 Tax=Alkaliphilus peptidifermentans DSM 18978 TaxID=1120976 RepID=A0A1G5JFV0_9FIRM|nr:CBS domain-containing protein [Alkaliphilus peptidifermentans]SCY87235.1 CBS domain-containing protein [Alkaliphilus peptidifermentans DSM 18978]